MSVYECKMCGAPLPVTEGMTVCECTYCGSIQTLPHLDSDVKRNMYERAAHFMRANEYDKAERIYNDILSEDPSDPEAYWSQVLCKYGIEYVEDPATHKRMPTINRMQTETVLSDEDYKSALEYADGYQRDVYEAEAKRISEIQHEFFEISKNETPFDVFICYKETDSYGRRTQDSALAAELYDNLSKEGLKVFFARYTLEDKLGEAYEPYIFAALNSAKVMVVLGTSRENFNAVWVKNEWSRFLAITKKDRSKALIPAYKNMDPYDLPEEFAHLQAQDMGKLGFMQDIVRGIKKIIYGQAEKKAEAVAQASATAGVNSLLERASLFLGDGDWVKASEYCERVLDIDPKNAQAYVLNLLAGQKVSSLKQLAVQDFDLVGDPLFNKAKMFSDGDFHKQLDDCEKENIYSRAARSMKRAKNNMDTDEVPFLNSSKKMFSTISDYKDSKQLMALCDKEINKRYENRKKYLQNQIQLQNEKLMINGTMLQELEEQIKQSNDSLDSDNNVIENVERITTIRASITMLLTAVAIIMIIFSIVSDLGVVAIIAVVLGISAWVVNITLDAIGMKNEKMAKINIDEKEKRLKDLYEEKVHVKNEIQQVEQIIKKNEEDLGKIK